jgi:hypothetical protein
MIAIDLSRMARGMLYDIENLKDRVLFSEVNRTWISYPAAEDAWRSASDRVKALAAEESGENKILGIDAMQNTKETILDAPAPRTFRLEETKPLPKAVSTCRYRTWQPCFVRTSWRTSFKRRKQASIDTARPIHKCA